LRVFLLNIRIQFYFEDFKGRKLMNTKTYLPIGNCIGDFYSRCNLMAWRLMMLAPALFFPGMVRAQSAADGMVNAVCGIIGPFMGKSKVVSLVFLLALGVMMFLWWMNENKEGVLTWVLRTGLAVAVIINIFSAPQLVGLPPICSGSSFT
jgi:hypothetical protein